MAIGEQRNMRTYAYKAMAELAAELAAGLVRLRKGYVDAAEALMQIITPDREYPYDFVLYRITGYRSRGAKPAAAPMSGRKLREDLQRLMLDVCESFALHSDDYSETVYDTASLARRFSVSTKTIQRWRSRGLPTRRLIFLDGKRRIAFLDSSVRWFVDKRRDQIDRSVRFTQLTASQRREIIRRARRMASFTHCTLSDVARRLAAKTGRAVETIRYTIRRHDLENPQEAVFPRLTSPLGDQEKAAIYRRFLRGASVPDLAEHYLRTRGSIYRVINEMRARQLISRPINYVYNPQFELPNADEIFLSGPEVVKVAQAAKAKQGKLSKAPKDLPPYLRSLYSVALLDAEQERKLFGRYNYLKHKADQLRKKIDVNRIRTSQLKEIERLLLQANVVKNAIVRANLRLVVSIAKKHPDALRAHQRRERFAHAGGGEVRLFTRVSVFHVRLLGDHPELCAVGAKGAIPA